MIAVSGADGLLQLTVTGKEHEEFRELVARATNTWDTMPKWVRIISDTLEQNPDTQHF